MAQDLQACNFYLEFHLKFEQADRHPTCSGHSQSFLRLRHRQIAVLRAVVVRDELRGLRSFEQWHMSETEMMCPAAIA
jgi:hypothetical protein